LEEPTAETSNIDDLYTRLNADEFDLVGIGSALLGDSQWSNKVKTNRFNHINEFDEKALNTLK